ncbi:hypothetical protein GCM10011514_41350 [Emticicia aquatilis]|uniref:non-specific serine/threonine protein kinase n=1 Tax=Emticicia aquatilis TaxID=1537369 RepID=A0A916Z2G1_9BACT|nr:COR domain-containing protein [Emticicia aquatilis]GGD73013.1 hypothetical protein GCM10011514_41350 [Emticicia aquatilis]
MSDIAIELIEKNLLSKDRVLDLGNCGLNGYLPEILSKCHWLKKVNLGNKYFDEDTSQWVYSRNSGLPNSFNGNELSQLNSLKKLEFLSCNNCEINDILFLTKLGNLKYLDLSNNKIDDCRFISHLENIQILILENSNIWDIGYLSNLNKLRKIILSNNNVERLNSLQNLEGLEYVDLSNNLISFLGFISNLANLKYLNLSNNKIYDISPIANLHKIEILDLSKNYIIKINPIEKLINLKSLNFSSNEIHEIPIRIVKNIKIDWLLENDYSLSNKVMLFDNPLSENIKNSIKIGGREGLLEFLKSIQYNQHTSPLNECKVIIVGLGSAGKTSLMRRLYDGSYKKGEAETHSINKLSKNFGEIKVNFWDFGGQHIKHALHQFFFTQKTFYILVLDGRKEEKPTYWLEQIDSLGRHSPVFIVFNKIDYPSQLEEIDTEEIRDKYRNIKDFYYLSCETKLNLNKFISDLSKCIAEADFLKEPYHDEFFILKEVLENVTEHYISYSQYEELVQKQKFKTIENKEFWLKTLHQIGVISYFPKVPDFQILNPEWLTVGIYHLFLHPICVSKKGRLVESDLYEIFKYPVINSINKKEFFYNNHHHKYLLNLMKEFQLCTENPIKNNEWLIPKGFAPKAKISFDIFRNRPLAGKLPVLYAFEYITWIPSTILRVIASLLPFAHEEDYWKNGILVKHAESNTQALVYGDEDSKRINVWIKGEQIREFWIVLDTVITMMSSFFETNKFQKIVFIDIQKNQFISYQYLLNAFIDGIDNFYHPEFRKNINVIDLLKLFKKNEDLKNEISRYRKELDENIFKDDNNEGKKTYQTLAELKLEEYERKELLKVYRNWKLFSLALFVISLISTSLIILSYEYELIISNTKWAIIKQSNMTKYFGFFIGFIWNSIVGKLLYDRYFDNTKQKTKIEQIEKEMQKKNNAGSYFETLG